MRGQAIAARLAPELADLRKRFGKQPERLQREMTALYRREGTSMFAGLSPMLLQWPLLSVMYLLFRSAGWRRPERAAFQGLVRCAAGHVLAQRDRAVRCGGRGVPSDVHRLVGTRTPPVPYPHSLRAEPPAAPTRAVCAGRRSLPDGPANEVSP